MVRVIQAGEAKDLGLPGRKSLEIVSGSAGSSGSTLRLVEIPPLGPDDPPRKMHRHTGFEECSYVLSGEGLAESESGKFDVKAGDTILVPAGEWHVTHNTGDEPLMLLCFFPTPDCNVEQK